MDAEKMMMQKRIDNFLMFNDFLLKKLKAVQKERDALEHDLYFECYDSPHACYICKYGQNGVAQCQRDLDEDDCFVWRGVCAENGGVANG